MSARGELVTELGKYSAVSMVDSQQSVLLKTWTREDEEVSSDRVALLELKENAVLLHRMHVQLSAEVERAGLQLDAVESEVAKTKESTEGAVAVLTEASIAKAASWVIMSPTVGLLVVGASFLHGGPAGLIIAKGLFAGCASLTGAVGLAVWQQQLLENMKRTMEESRSWEPMRPEDSQQLDSLAQDAQERLVSRLLDDNAWQKYVWSASGLWLGMGVQYAESLGRPGGHAFRTCFEAPLSASEAFFKLQRLKAEGSLDPGCNAMWSRPVTEDGATTMRYLMFTTMLANCDFLVVLRCARVRRAEGDDESGSLYAMSVVSVPPELFHLAPGCLDKKDGQVIHGCIHLCGALIEGLGPDRCKVHMTGDADTRNQQDSLRLEPVVDRDVRLHMFAVAELLRSKLGA